MRTDVSEAVSRAATGGRVAVAALGLLWLAVAGPVGCGSQPYAAPTNEILPEEADSPVPGRADQELDAGQEGEVLSAMRSMAAGERPVSPPAKAPFGVRWSDIPVAVGFAVNEPGVEVTVVETIEEVDLYVFRLRTVEGWPGWLVIRRTGGPDVYEVADVQIGRFPDYPAHVERRDRLVEEFEKKLKELGRQRWFNEESH